MPLLSSSLVINTHRYGKLLLLADTHVGYEVELLMKGIRVPRQTKRMIEHYIELIEKEKADSLAILGDVKHEIASVVETYRDVELFITELSERVERLVLLQGNHDGMLDKIVQKLSLRNVEYYDSRGTLVETTDGKKIILIHGNAKPRLEDLVKADYLVMGHTHPAVTIRDVVGYTVREAVIVRVELSKKEVISSMFRKDELKKCSIDIESIENKIVIVILPCANILITGTDITRTLLQKSPSKTILIYFKLWEKPDKIEVYLPDLTYLGTLKELLELEKIVETREKVDWDLL
ncbi:MAG: metallophosphoesterase [Crenarchaeota archaeon]|nr:metallophosphoesterase [Thermoproteota archaeon]